MHSWDFDYSIPKTKFESSSKFKYFFQMATKIVYPVLKHILLWSQIYYLNTKTNGIPIWKDMFNPQPFSPILKEHTLFCFKLLLLDDNLAERNIIELMLSKKGCHGVIKV